MAQKNGKTGPYLQAQLFPFRILYFINNISNEKNTIY